MIRFSLLISSNIINPYLSSNFLPSILLCVCVRERVREREREREREGERERERERERGRERERDLSSLEVKYDPCDKKYITFSCRW